VVFLDTSAIVYLQEWLSAALAGLCNVPLYLCANVVPVLLLGLV